MTAAFLAWAVCFAATAELVHLDRVASTRPAASRMLVALLVFAAIGAIVTAAFHTDTSAGRLPPGTRRSTGGLLHDYGSLAIMVATFLAATVSAFVIRVPTRFRRRVAVLLAAAVVVDLLLLAVGTEVAGVRQRCLVAAGCAWLAWLLGALRERARTTTQRAVSLRTSAHRPG